jgi:hypothetical protein
MIGNPESIMPTKSDLLTLARGDLGAVRPGRGSTQAAAAPESASGMVLVACVRDTRSPCAVGQEGLLEAAVSKTWFGSVESGAGDRSEISGSPTEGAKTSDPKVCTRKSHTSSVSMNAA